MVFCYHLVAAALLVTTAVYSMDVKEKKIISSQNESATTGNNLIPDQTPLEEPNFGYFGEEEFQPTKPEEKIEKKHKKTKQEKHRITIEDLQRAVVSPLSQISDDKYKDLTAQQTQLASTLKKCVVKDDIRKLATKDDLTELARKSDINDLFTDIKDLLKTKTTDVSSEEEESDEEESEESQWATKEDIKNMQAALLGEMKKAFNEQKNKKEKEDEKIVQALDTGAKKSFGPLTKLSPLLVLPIVLLFIWQHKK